MNYFQKSSFVLFLKDKELKIPILDLFGYIERKIMKKSCCFYGRPLSYNRREPSPRRRGTLARVAE